MKNAYTALSEIYDELMYDVDYDEWTDYIDSFLKEINAKKIAELCCGTGNITFRLIKKGYSVIPSDISEEMLETAKEKSRKLGKRVMFINQDMREIDLPIQDAIVCACDGANYLNSEADLYKFIKSAYEHIKPGGILAFDMSSEYKLENVLGENLFFEDRDDLSLFWQNSYNKANKSVELSLSIFIKESDGRYRREDEVQTQYAYPVYIVIELLIKAGFKEVNAYDFLTREAVKNDSQRIQFVAKK